MAGGLVMILAGVWLLAQTIRGGLVERVLPSTSHSQQVA